jgi:hypothetical protein
MPVTRRRGRGGNGDGGDVGPQARASPRVVGGASTPARRNTRVACRLPRRPSRTDAERRSQRRRRRAFARRRAVPPASAPIRLPGSNVSWVTSGEPSHGRAVPAASGPTQPTASKAVSAGGWGLTVAAECHSRRSHCPSSGPSRSSTRRRRRLLLHQPQHFAGLRMASQGLLREDATPVDLHLEHAARRLNQLHVSVGVGLADLGRQTGGPGLVVSDDAVFDGDAHAVNDSCA